MMTDYDWIDDYQLDRHLKWEAELEAVKGVGYEDYPQTFQGEFIDETTDSYTYDWNYAYGADAAYKNNPQRIMNDLMAYVF
jgi:hypothetical protein